MARQRIWLMLLGLMSGLAIGSTGLAQPTASHRITARWGGQVARDLVGPYSELKSNGIRDICIVLDGLPRNHQITWARITGDGGSEWQYNGGHGPYAAALVRSEGSDQAVLFIEPDRVETGRAFFIDLKFDNDAVINLTVAGGRADPALRMPGAEVLAEFRGNTGQDLVGATPAVGPDGLQDVVIGLSNLPADTQLARVRVLAGEMRWESGLNPEGHLNLEVVPDPADATRAQVHLQPPRPLRGSIEIELTYANNARDRLSVRAMRHSANKVVDPPPTVTLTPNRFAVQWHGQDAAGGGDRGDIHLSITGLPRGRSVVAAGLSDAAGGYWAWRANDQVPFEISQWDRSLKVIHDVVGGRLALFFPAFRDERDASMSLWLLFDDGRMTFTPFKGEACDPFLYGEPPATSKVVAKPGDNLHLLAAQHGTIELSPGVYRLTEPLVLDRPITLTGPREAILEFAQETPIPWPAAVKIHRSNTTLRGFTIRFATPVVWKRDELFVPAVIGTTDRGDGHQPDPKRNLTIENMRIESPESADPSQLEECPRILHFASAISGRIIGNELRGGITEFVRGPWIVKDNTYLGCPEGFWAWDAFSTRWTHDVVVENNHLRPLPNSGKTWRFLVLAAYGFNNIVRNNRVENIGIRDDDTIPNPNAAEIVLTEAYTVKFEGCPAAIGDSGRVLQLPLVHVDAPRSGDCVAILTGPHAGRWFPIAQAISPTVLLMDQPLPAGDYDISIATGFTNLLFEGNTIDSTGSSTAGNLILVGNHFGPIVRNNHLIGGGAFKLAACPTERPNIWGWTHCPYVGDIVEGNIFENSGGAMLGSEYGKPIKSTRGRTYRSGVFRNNIFRYDDAALDRPNLNRLDGKVVPMVVSDPGGLDPSDTAVRIENTIVEVPPDRQRNTAAVIHVRSAVLNGKPLVDQPIPVPVQPVAAQINGGAP